jgi:biotin carboxyl carrier protein
MNYYVTIANQEHCIALTPMSDGRFECQIDEGLSFPVSMSRNGDRIHLLSGLQTASLNLSLDSGDVSNGGPRSTFKVESAMLRALKSATGADGGGTGDGVILSPMPGRVVKNLVAEGDRVTIGQGVVVIEAMKMENELKASVEGVVSKLYATDDDLVESGAPLIEITPDI